MEKHWAPLSYKISCSINKSVPVVLFLMYFFPLCLCSKCVDPPSALSFLDATEEFFEYDAEEFLVFLTLLITEGRTPEYSVKGRTEGLHCPPAQSAMPPLHKHECSDKLPQVAAPAQTSVNTVFLAVQNGRRPTLILLLLSRISGILPDL